MKNTYKRNCLIIALAIIVLIISIWSFEKGTILGALIAN